MRALASLLAAGMAGLLAMAPASAQAPDTATALAATQPCAPGDLDRYKAADMVADAELRGAAEAALDACAAYAQDQATRTGEIEERILVQIAALTGRTTYAAYAADEIPRASPAMVTLLMSSFRALYPHLRALSEEENTAAMRTILFHFAEQGAPATTGSIRSPEARP